MDIKKENLTAHLTQAVVATCFAAVASPPVQVCFQ